MKYVYRILDLFHQEKGTKFKIFLTTFLNKNFSKFNNKEIVKGHISGITTRNVFGWTFSFYFTLPNMYEYEKIGSTV